jgi:hypothetical protein
LLVTTYYRLSNKSHTRDADVSGAPVFALVYNWARVAQSLMLILRNIVLISPLFGFTFFNCGKRILLILKRRVWRYQRGNQNPYIEEEQKTQWPKEKIQNDKQRSTKHTYKAKDRVTRTPLKTGGELRCSGRVSTSCSTSDTRRVNLFKGFPLVLY